MIENIRTIVSLILENKNKKLSYDISPETRLREDLGFDSLDLAEFTVRIEEKYNIDIFEEGILNTIGEVIGKIEPNQVR